MPADMDHCDRCRGTGLLGDMWTCGDCGGAGRGRVAKSADAAPAPMPAETTVSDEDVERCGGIHLPHDPSDYDGKPCVKPKGHEGRHEDSLMGTWSDHGNSAALSSIIEQHIAADRAARPIDWAAVERALTSDDAIAEGAAWDNLYGSGHTARADVRGILIVAVAAAKATETGQ